MAAFTGAILGGVASATIASKASRKASRASQKATDATVAEQRRQYDQTRQDLEPYRASGAAALDRLNDPTAFMASPDYEFRRNEGVRDLGNYFSAMGGGGNAIRGATQFASNLASSEYGNWFNRQFGLAEQGRGATGSIAVAGQQMADQIGRAYGTNAANQGNIAMNRASAVNSAVQGTIGNVLYAGRDPHPELQPIDMSRLPKRRG